MNSGSWNFVAMAFLGMVFFIMGVTFLSAALYHSDDPETPGYAIAVAEVDAGVSETAAEPTIEPVAPLLASADLAAGEKVAKKCVACHSFNEGGANKVGPALWNVVNRPIAAVDGFGYSNALREYAEGKVWDYTELNGFLYRPKQHVKGTSMGFAGLKKVDVRASIIAYLRSLSGEPAPLPES